jgi:DNA replication protein DnaC
MGDIAYLRKDYFLAKPGEEEDKTGKRPFNGFVIPEWMFDERPHIVSRDDPKSLTYVCQVCGLVEPKHKRNGYLRVRCECEKAMYDDMQQSLAKAEMQATMNLHRTNRTYTWLGDSDDALLDKSFQGFNLTYQPDAFRECENYARLFIDARKVGDTFSRNILMMGGYGTGKTHLASAILNELRAQMIPCLYSTAQGFFDALYSKSFEGKESLKESAIMTPLLVIDELDKLYVKMKDDMSYQQSTLTEILDRRYKRRLPTILITNEQKDLSVWLNGATMSRLQERITLLSMNGMDYRSKKG